MFKDLLVLEKQRTWKEAFGFYLAYSLLWVVVSLILITVYLFVWVPLTGTPTGSPEEAAERSSRFGAASAPIWCGLLASLVVERKGHSRTLKYLLIGALSFALAVGWGLFPGMVPTAYLTTIKPEGPPAP